MTEKQTPDWERIEQLYRAGLLSVREIATACGVSHTAIQKKAKALGWERDLQAKIKAKADSLVAKAEVAKEVATETLATERGIVDANAKVIADIRIGHRTDIGRYRRLANKLLEELEGLTDNRDLFSQLGELLLSPDDNGVDRLNDLYRKVIDLPNRTKVMKELGETLKNLITLERQAYGLTGDDAGGPATPADDAFPTDPVEAAKAYQKLMG
ncbi:hypothetical protein ACOKS3_17440 [Pseudomonas sp. HS6-2]|uniref:hypothetical protein n=1 Tax=Pseudomonas sp. HS6-2 TaxID=3410986 RepID=UPI003BDA6F9A